MDATALIANARLETLSLSYLASPYTLFKPNIDAAYEAIGCLSKRLTEVGIRHFSPILYTHPLAKIWGRDPLDWKYWMEFDRPFMEACDTLLIAKLDGWDISVGIHDEKDAFSRAGKPIYFVDPITMEISR